MLLEDDAWMRRRREAAARLPRLWCGCRDPLEHECVEAPLMVIEGIPLQNWRAARDHLAREGYPAALPARVSQLLGESEAV